MSGKHPWTEGPWTWTKDSQGRPVDLIGRRPGDYVLTPQADVTTYGLSVDRWSDTSEADERLIAAAPELYERAEAYLHALDAKRQFERDNPNNSTKAWDDLLYAIEYREAELRAALFRAEGRE